MQSQSSTAFRRDPLQFLLDLVAGEVKPLEPLPSGGGRHYLVTDPVLARCILKASEVEIDKGDLVKKWRPLLGDSFLTLTGPEHHRRRDALHRHLAKGVTGRYVPEMQAAVNATLPPLMKARGFDAHEFAAPLALNLSCIAMFGHDVLTAGDRAALIEAVRLIEDDLAQAMLGANDLSPKERIEQEERRLHGRRLLTLVVERVRQRGGESSMLRALDGLGLSRQDAEDEIITMLVAGHHTAGTAGAWLLYHMAAAPDLAAAIAEESREISDADGEATPQSIKRARLTQAFVQEVLRLYPSAWWFAREMRVAGTVGGRALEAGDALIISPWLFQRDPRYWNEPGKLRFDRDYSVPAYMPFGAGPRVCVGMTLALLELQLIALTMASAFELRTPQVGADLKPSASVTLIPPPIRIELSPRGAKTPAKRSRIVHHEHA